MDQLTIPIRNYLKQNNFYPYYTQTEIISNNYFTEYQQVAAPEQKRNLNLKTYWQDITSFGEPRHIIVLDLGGTNLNIFEVEVKDEEAINVLKNTSTGFYEDKVYTPEILFSDLRAELDKFLPEAERSNIKNLVFVFSYPIEQIIRPNGRIDAICTDFVKEHKSDGIIGIQVGKNFEQHLKANGYPHINVSVTNDTPIHVLAAKAYELLNHKKFDIALNLIVGTGCNAAVAYNETELPEVKGLRIINTEFGGFKGAPLSKFDEIFKASANNPNVHLNEKMISGGYQSKILKIILSELEQAKLIPTELNASHNINAMNAGQIDQLVKSNKLTKEHQVILDFLWREINKRAGGLCGIFLARIMSEQLSKLKQPHMDVIIIETGSVIQKNLNFKDNLFDTIDQELGRLKAHSNISYQIASLPHQPAYGSTIFDTLSIHS